MSEPRVMNRSYFFAATGLVGLAIIGLALCGCRHEHHPPKKRFPAGGNNPPVVVAGGSIYGDSSAGSGVWSVATSCNASATTPLEYCSDVSGGTNVLTSSGYTPAINMPPIPPGESWTIHITDKDSQGNDDPKEGVVLCGNPTLVSSTGRPCNELAPSDPNYVYINPYDENNAKWDNSVPSLLYYQDTSDNCQGSYNSSHKHGMCEHPSYAILSIGNVVQTTSQCTQAGCWIGVGTPKSSKK